MNQVAEIRYESQEELLTEEIARASYDRPNARILSIGCAGLPLAELRRSISEKRIVEFVVIDENSEEIARLQDQFRCSAVRAISAPIRILLYVGRQLGTFDLIYLARPYELRRHEFAAHLRTVLLRPGGRLLICDDDAD